MSRTGRMRKELHDIISGVDKTIAIKPVELNGKTWYLRGLILAPEGTPMENYVLSLSIKINENYPFTQPAIAFENKVWHPCVDFKTGELCIFDPFCPSSNVWKRYFTLETCLASIQDMLREPFLNSVRNVRNYKAYDQFFQNRDQFNCDSKAYVTESNEGYGKVSFDDHRIASIQTIIRVLELPNIVDYECSIFCQQNSCYTWNLFLFAFPSVDIYKHYAAEHTQQFSLRLTTFKFKFEPTDHEIKVGIPKDGVSKDKCWAIRPVSTALLIKRDECDADPRKFKNRTPSCELSLEWTRPEITPRRLIEKITLNGPGSKLIYSVDVTLDPSNFEAWAHDLNIQTCFKKLLPLAAEWQNIGCLLGIPDGKLKQIKLDEGSAENCMREMLNTWLKQKPTSWATLAEAVQHFDQGIAEEL